MIHFSITFGLFSWEIRIIASKVSTTHPSNRWIPKVRRTHAVPWGLAKSTNDCLLAQRPLICVSAKYDSISLAEVMTTRRRKSGFLCGNFTEDCWSFIMHALPMTVRIGCIWSHGTLSGVYRNVVNPDSGQWLPAWCSATSNVRIFGEIFFSLISFVVAPASLNGSKYQGSVEYFVLYMYNSAMKVFCWPQKEAPFVFIAFFGSGTNSALQFCSTPKDQD